MALVVSSLISSRSSAASFTNLAACSSMLSLAASRSVVLSPLQHSQHRGPRPQVTLRLSDISSCLVRQVVGHASVASSSPSPRPISRFPDSEDSSFSKGRDLNSSVLQKYVHLTQIIFSAVPNTDPPKSFARHKEYLGKVDRVLADS